VVAVVVAHMLLERVERVELVVVVVVLVAVDQH
jgi:hypothetical protein